MIELARELRKRPTPAEKLVWDRLRKRQLKGLKFRRQHPIGPYIVDFYCAVNRLVVEIDGGYHQERVEEDSERSAYLKGEGCQVIRFANREVLENLEGVMKKIGDAVGDGLPSPPTPLPGRERGGSPADSAQTPDLSTPKGGAGMGEAAHAIGGTDVADSQQPPRGTNTPSPQGGEGRGEGDSLLKTLDVTPEQVLSLSGNDSRSFLNFLLRWKCFDDVHVCLDVLIPRNPTHVSLRDARARVLLGQGRPVEAQKVMQARLKQADSSVARAKLARICLANSDVATARQIAMALVDERPESAMVWNLLGEVEMARGDEVAARSAYWHLHELFPNSRAYLLGMASFYAIRDDWVTASGYAVQLLRMGEEGNPLSVEYLRRLRDYFSASGETTRVGQLERDLERRRAEEVAEWRERIGDLLGAPPRSERRPTSPTRRPEDRGQPAGASVDEVERSRPDSIKALPSFHEIPVSEEERRTIADAAQRLFGFDALLPGQAETMACVLRGEDVLTILPTGGGKSLCYQLPAMMSCLSDDGGGDPAGRGRTSGVTLVISPLVALMKDQVDSLPRQVRPRATTLNHTLARGELNRCMDGIADGVYRLVYAAPERLRQPPFLHALRNAGVDRLVIDEAHCVSMWGHDFRPDYLTIGRVRQELGDPPLLAMTATAPLRVRRDILQRLGRCGRSDDGVRVIAGDVTRPNLQLEVLQARDNDQKLRHLLAFCKSEGGSGIVYADTRVRCERLAALLRQHGVNAGHYHAGIRDRHRVQDDFMEGRTRIIVATIAFGMGIDKPDIRFIVHFFPPDSVEAYYQEAGRAGRDGLPARCLLMVTNPDKGLLTRRARRSLLTVDFLRQVYACVREQLGGKEEGRIVMADLERSLRADDTHIRVALSLLEEVGLLRRGPDVPRSASVNLSAACQDSVLPDELRAFCQAARLRPQQWLTVDVIEVAASSGIALSDVEKSLLKWDDEGWIRCRPVGRDLLVTLLPAPDDAGERVERLLERYETVQVQRVDEIGAYAGTRACRHGHLNAYLGGRSIERCDGCDNCVVIAPPPDPGLPSERAQFRIVLSCAANGPWSWGRHTLLRILRGEGKGRHGTRDLNEKAVAQAEFGALSFRSKTATQRMVEQLEHGGFLAARPLGRGGVVLDLTRKGREALRNPNILPGLSER